jgi:hypothetical protein
MWENFIAYRPISHHCHETLESKENKVTEGNLVKGGKRNEEGKERKRLGGRNKSQAKKEEIKTMKEPFESKEQKNSKDLPHLLQFCTPECLISRVIQQTYSLLQAAMLRANPLVLNNSPKHTRVPVSLFNLNSVTQI